MKLQLSFNMRHGLTAAFLTFLGSVTALAGLGESEISISKDAAKISAKNSKKSIVGEYKIYDLNSDSVQVKEWVNSKGNVFAVTWSGVAQPDLSKLFGNYHQEFLHELAHVARAHGRHSQTLTTAHLVIERSGHMRALKGRAILKSEIPGTLTLGDIK